jgi:hypothetical protein
MNRVWTGVVAGVLAAALLLSVGVGAYRAGQDDDVAARVVRETSDGQVVRVIEDGGRWAGHGPGFLFPLVIIVILVLVFSRGHRHRWHGGYGHGYGPGPGYPRGRWGPGGGPDEYLDEWHRQAHWDEPAGTPTAPTPTAPTTTPTPTDPPDETTG